MTTGRELAVASSIPAGAAMGSYQQEQEFVTMLIDNQLFGIPVLAVQDVLRPQKITPIPLARGEVAGLMNLRGRIVTVIDLRSRLSLPPYQGSKKQMNVVVEYNDELYSLLVDSVGEVMRLPLSHIEKSPANLSLNWREVSDGIYRLKGELLVIIDVKQLLNL